VLLRQRRRDLVAISTEAAAAATAVVTAAACALRCGTRSCISAIGRRGRYKDAVDSSVIGRRHVAHAPASLVED